jgi:hypothetical protein
MSASIPALRVFFNNTSSAVPNTISTREQEADALVLPVFQAMQV